MGSDGGVEALRTRLRVARPASGDGQRSRGQCGLLSEAMPDERKRLFRFRADGYQALRRLS